MRRIAGWTVATIVIAAGLAACGEKAQVTVYQQGTYQGKSDDLPWANDRFKNDKVEWEKAIKARTSGQNEYAR